MKLNTPKLKQVNLFKRDMALPPYMVYKNPKNNYENFINQYCRLPCYLEKHSLHKDLIDAANREWKVLKTDTSRLDELMKMPIHQAIEDSSAKEIWPETDQIIKEKQVISEIREKTEDQGGEDIEKKSVLKRKFTASDTESFSTKKMSRNPHTLGFIDLEKICNYLFENETNDTASLYRNQIIEYFKTDQNKLSDFLTLMTTFVTNLQEYKKVSKFSKKESALQTFISEMNIERKKLLENFITLKNLNDNIAKMFLEGQNLLSAVLNISQNKKIREVEEERDTQKLLYFESVARISGKIGLSIHLLRARVINAKSHHRAKIAQPYHTDMFRFEAVNLFGDWNYIKKILDFIELSENPFLPFSYDNIVDVFKLFKDEDLVVIRYSTIYQLIFGGQDEDIRQKYANEKCFKSILLKYFPLMFVTLFKEQYVLDLSKFASFPSEILDSILYFIYELDEGDKVMVSLKKEEEIVEPNDAVEPEAKIEVKEEHIEYEVCDLSGIFANVNVSQENFHEKNECQHQSFQWISPPSIPFLTLHKLIYY